MSDRPMPFAVDSSVVDWLLDGDPAVVWQTQRDLLGLPASKWQQTRRRVATEGWGARLLARRMEDGQWGGGLYQPKWTSTFYTLQLLTQLGLPPTNRHGRQSCSLLIERGTTPSGGVSLWSSARTDTCVTAMLLSMACYFGFGRENQAARMVAHLLDEQMDDGGWNCNFRSTHRTGASHASFHTTISVIEGLSAHAAAAEADKSVLRAIHRGGRFFEEHHLYRSSTTGREIKPSFAQISFPPRWFFDILRGLEHFARIDAKRATAYANAVSVLEKKQRKDGLWPAQNSHTGQIFFRLEAPRAPCHMNTLRALRVLRWWYGGLRLR